MSFVPRLEAPVKYDPLWVNTAWGGLNGCIVIDEATGWVLPDCTGYAWGRFSEILGEPCTLSRADAGKWFGYFADGYDRGFVPMEGAVMCFDKPGDCGHVCVVEEVREDGSILTSESGYSSKIDFWTKVRRPPFDYGEYLFQGFIYNPAVSKTKRELFVEQAESQVGKDNSWTCETVKLSRNQAWSAAFVVACAKVAEGILNVIIPNTFSSSALGRVGLLRKYGQWLKGPAQGNYPEPEVGDIVIFRKGNYSGVNTYFGDHAGIVSEVSGNVTVIEGDCGGIVRQNTYGTNSRVISGYFRPNWKAVDEGDGSLSPYRKVQGLYTSLVSKNDAAVREVAFLNSRYQPSIDSSKFKLSVINYTGLLGQMYSVFGGQLVASDAANTTGKAESTVVVSPSLSSGTPTDRQGVKNAVYAFLTYKGLSSAAAAGIMGNIQSESNFNLGAVGDKGTSFGLCQWHNTRGTAMKNMAGENWATNVTGQMNYLWFELTNSYSALVTFMRNVPNTPEGAAQVADQFVRKFERPANPDAASIKRQSNARIIFSEYITQL